MVRLHLLPTQGGNKTSSFSLSSDTDDSFSELEEPLAWYPDLASRNPSFFPGYSPLQHSKELNSTRIYSVQVARSQVKVKSVAAASFAVVLSELGLDVGQE